MKQRHTATEISPRALQKSSREEAIERIYREWDEALAHSDVEALLEFYAVDAVIESPLIPHLLGKARGICTGREEMRPFFEALRERKPPVRQHFRTGYFTDGKKVIWEYPRATQKDDQMDFTESMDINDDGLIQHHRVYWGWFGFGVLQRDEYHKKSEEKEKAGATKPQTPPPPTEIAGYNFGKPTVAHSPVSLQEFEELKQTAAFTDEDVRQLRLAGDVLEDQTEEIINTWRGVIGRTPHLAYYFTGPDHKPDENYKTRVKERFKQWILDLCRRPYNQDWLNYQHEIGLRHTHLKKNETEGAATPPQIPLRHILAFTAVVNETIKPFLAKKGASAEAVEAMHRAWCKATLLHVTLWSRAYMAESDW
jgi:hypothetical protein